MKRYGCGVALAGRGQVVDCVIMYYNPIIIKCRDHSEMGCGVAGRALREVVDEAQQKKRLLMRLTS